MRSGSARQQFMIKVQTVGHEQFREGCGRLWDIAQQTFRPDLVVGIRSGGWRVAEEMKTTRAPRDVVFVPLTCRRPTSDVKGNSQTFKLVLKVLPYFVLDGLRLVEYYALTLPRCRAVVKHGAGEPRVSDPAEVDAIRAAAAGLPPGARVLVVDDSLDSGATLVSVITTLRSVLPPDVEVRTAAFTVLGPTPIVDADFFLYRHINCRFPWSYDFHG
jgi:hypoxanthine phosphoribosyltransferase